MSACFGGGSRHCKKPQAPSLHHHCLRLAELVSVASVCLQLEMQLHPQAHQETGFDQPVYLSECRRIFCQTRSSTLMALFRVSIMPANSVSVAVKSAASFLLIVVAAARSFSFSPVQQNFSFEVSQTISEGTLFIFSTFLLRSLNSCTPVFLA